MVPRPFPPPPHEGSGSETSLPHQQLSIFDYEYQYRAVIKRLLVSKLPLDYMLDYWTYWNDHCPHIVHPMRDTLHIICDNMGEGGASCPAILSVKLPSRSVKGTGSFAAGASAITTSPSFTIRFRGAALEPIRSRLSHVILQTSAPPPSNYSNHGNTDKLLCVSKGNNEDRKLRAGPAWV